ncbi:hypothetical protein [Streptomyces sp. DH8]|uniref:hypothetical protein n=1 Tax=Streptomyces sp. DH8 TaxID=2857008 RepID=UPI001E64A74B|nr:hypothetical protein [Streptomyces sp. DH8]
MTETQLPDDMAAYGGILMDTRPWLYADTAADALRRLSLCTDNTDMEGWATPEDGYRVTGHLVTVTARLPELLGGIEYLIAAHDQDVEAAEGDTQTALTAFYAEVRAAQAAAKETIAALGRVHARLGTLKEAPPADELDRGADPQPQSL